MVGKPRVAMPPLLTAWSAEPLRLAGVLDLAPEMLGLLRYGRAVDTSRDRRAGFRCHYTTPGTVEAFAGSLRLERNLGEGRPTYRYERDVEDFFRHSPAVIRSGETAPDGAPAANQSPGSGPPTPEPVGPNPGGR